MASTLRIGIDASGGDFGTNVTIPATIEASKNPNIQIVVYGSVKEIGEQLQDHPIEYKDCRHPNQELRLAFDDLSSGFLQAVVTACNSRNLMVVAAHHRLPGVKKPGLLASIPTALRTSYIIDVGATAREDDPEVYLGWGQMACNHFGTSSLWIGLQNIAAERAFPELMKVHLFLQQKLPNYRGFIEPADFFAGKVDIMLSDGFLGNTDLKMLEAAAAFFFSKAYQSLEAIPQAVQTLDLLKTESLSYDAHLICQLLGVKGKIYRIHGNASVEQFAKGINLAAKRHLPASI